MVVETADKGLLLTNRAIGELSPSLLSRAVVMGLILMLVSGGVLAFLIGRIGP